MSDKPKPAKKPIPGRVPKPQKRGPDGKPVLGQPGHRHKFVKPTKAQVSERVAECERMLACKWNKCDIRRVITRRFKVDWRTVDRYLNSARGNLAARSGRTREQHRREALDVYEAVIRDPAAPRGERVRAQQCVDDLLGLRAPHRTEIAGPNQGPVRTADATPAPKLTRDRLRELALFVEQSRGNGHAAVTSEEPDNGTTKKNGGNGE